MEYLYDASGAKKKKAYSYVGRGVSRTDTVDYLGGFQYKNGVLQFFPTSEGYAKAPQLGELPVFSYIYNYTDHLGNVRLSYGDKNRNGSISPVDEIVEENNYYAFGMKHEGYNYNAGDVSYKYKYNGKEFQDELGLNLYDYGARNYDPAIGRWMNIDPLAENSRRWTPYNYAYNNPVFFIDPDGMQSDWFDKKSEKVAQKLEKKIDSKINSINKEISSIEKKGGNVGDRKDRVSELNKSKSDISSMRENKDIEFKYSKASSGNAHTYASEDNKTVTIATDKGTEIHETRHGGQYSRGEISGSGNSVKGYGVADEVDAYRAQYSFDGTFKYNSHNVDQSTGNFLNRAILDSKMFPPNSLKTINNINNINSTMVNDIGKMDYNLPITIIPMYPPNGITPQDFNNN